MTFFDYYTQLGLAALFSGGRRALDRAIVAETKCDVLISEKLERTNRIEDAMLMRQGIDPQHSERPRASKAKDRPIGAAANLHAFNQRQKEYIGEPTDKVG